MSVCDSICFPLWSGIVKHVAVFGLFLSFQRPEIEVQHDCKTLHLISKINSLLYCVVSLTYLFITHPSSVPCQAHGLKVEWNEILTV